MKILQVEEFIENRVRYQPIDVRSPGEYRQAHIPGAVNVPLFTDEERAVIGNTYKKEGIEQAKLLGLKLVAPHLLEMVDKILLQQEKRFWIYCWRGNASFSMCALMNALKYPVYQLSGGYKAFRRFIFRCQRKANLCTCICSTG